MEEEKIFSVSDLTQALKKNIESRFPFVWVRGELTNLSRSAAGHIYFSLKDNSSILDAVWFKQVHSKKELFNRITGEVYEDGPKASLADSIENGMELICAGSLSIYPPSGKYQLKVELVQALGLGALHELFQKLYAELDALGYFAVERKRKLPVLAKQIALITSDKGAVVHDFLHIANTRGNGIKILLYPVPVQGAEAYPAICEALYAANANEQNELIVLIRGGGSLEDLWVFNHKDLAKDIFMSRLPVLAGIGHAPDVSLADMTADVRALTPSHAAQLLWPEKSILMERLELLSQKMQKLFITRMAMLQKDAEILEGSLLFHEPKKKIAYLYQILVPEQKQLVQSFARRVFIQKTNLDKLSASLQEAPKASLHKLQKNLLSHQYLLQLYAQKRLRRTELRLSQDILRLDLGVRYLPGKKFILQNFEQRLDAVRQFFIFSHLALLEQLQLRLEAVNPFFPLSRGYALLKPQGANYIKSVDEVALGDTLYATVADGELSLLVTGKQKKKV